MKSGASTYLRFLAFFCVLGGLGLGATVWELIHQRVSLPFQNVYPVSVEFADASSIGTGEGEPVNVAGVKVGQVTGGRLADGRARVTLQIERHLVPASVERIGRPGINNSTKDMQIALDRGRPPAKPMPEGGRSACGRQVRRCRSRSCSPGSTWTPAPICRA